MARDERLRKRDRLRLRHDFARVFAARRRASGPLLVVYVAENGLPWSRLGLSVSRRVGHAVRRNYVRRRIREAFRTSRMNLPTGLDIVCVARPDAADPDHDLREVFMYLVARAARAPRIGHKPQRGRWTS
jgi:ribonuclease P protein component